MFGLNENDAQSTGNNDMAQSPPASMMQSNPFTDAPSSSPAPAAPSEPAAPPSSSSEPAAPAEPNPSASNSDDLLQLKEQALHSLQPLVGHLDQTPEERFKTTMMMIQATDNSSLVKDAYEAANQISDEKARAQALLDVVNEINYFTQHGSEDEAKA